MFAIIQADSTYRTFDNAQEAMSTYSKEQFRGHLVGPTTPFDNFPDGTSFALIRKIIGADADVIDAKPVTTAPTPNNTERTGELIISPIAQERIARHEKMLADRGIALPPPLFTPGTRVVKMGDDNFRTSRVAWENQADIVDAMRDVWRTVNAEKRHDKVVAVRDIKMNDNGMIDFGEGELPFEANGLMQFFSRNNLLFPRGGAYLRDIRTEERAWNVNTRIAAAGTGYDKTVVLRIRNINGKPQVFAAVSEGYTAFDADKVVEVLGKALKGSGMRGEVIYDPTTTNLRVTGMYHADKVVDLAAGDVFKVGVQFKANDTGGGAIIGDAVAWRNLCLNLIIIGTGKKNLVRRTHRGALNDVKVDMTAAAEEASVIFADFADMWGALRQTKASDVFESDTVADIFAELADMRELDLGVKRDTAVELLLKGWSNEPGDTLADIVNAVTSVHGNAAIDQYGREKWERSAGELVPVLAGRAMGIA